MRALGVLLAAVLAGAPAGAWADENSDLDMIPGAVASPPAAAETTTTPRGKFSLENATTVGALRGGLVVALPGQPPPRRQNRTSFDARWHTDLGPDVAFTLSDRVNLFARDGLAFGQGRTASNDLREAYFTWEPATRSYIEAGRINLRSGVALGYNPTDFFRARTLLDQATADPSALRENRLGTVMLRTQHIAQWGTVSLAYAPKLTDPSRIGAGATAPLDPHFDRTNASERFHASVHADIAGLAPEVSLYHDGKNTRIGLSASATIGQQIVVYGEWAGGSQQTLSAEAIGYGIRAGTLPAGFPILPAAGTGQRFRNDAAIGLSRTSAAKVTVNAEYLFHEAGFTRKDWAGWFRLGHALPVLAGPLWYIRGYAAHQQQPMARQQVFLRVAWSDSGVRDLDLAALTFINLEDGSARAQLSAVYNIDRNWTAGLYLAANTGAPRTDYGSLKSAVSGTAQVLRFF